jgi:hypothetical protein
MSFESKKGLKEDKYICFLMFVIWKAIFFPLFFYVTPFHVEFKDDL